MKAMNHLNRSILLFSAMLMAFSATAQWTNINSLSNHSFNELNFPSQQTGYAIVGLGGTNGNSLFKTENEGISWEEITPDLDTITNPQFQSIFFVDDQSGFLTLRANVPRLKSFLFKTENGGSSWANITPDSLPVGYGLSDVFFTDLNQGFVTFGDRLYRSVDGGANWSLSLQVTWAGFNDIHFYDGNFGLVGAWDGTFAYQGLIFTTTDGGLSWDSLILNQYQTAIGRVVHVGDSTAFAMTDQGWGHQRIFTTTNNGNSWDTLSLKFLADSSDIAMDLHFLHANWGYLITANGYIFETVDGGQNWSQAHFETPGLQDLAFNGRSFFVGGPVNTLLKHSVPLEIDEPANDGSDFIYPNPCERGALLSFQEPQSGMMEISDLNGRIVFSEKLFRQASFSLQKTGLVAGIYLLRIKGEKPLLGKLVVKE